MRGMVGLMMVAGSLVACGPDAYADAAFDELCGEAGPVRLLELGARDRVGGLSHYGLFDERHVFEVRYRGDEWGADELPDTDREETWSVGTCGEDPILLSEENISIRLLPERWPNVLLECDWDSGDLTTLDPAQVSPPNRVFQSHRCFLEEIEAGAVSIIPNDEEVGRLVLQPWPDDPWTQPADVLTLVDAVRFTADEPHSGPSEREVLAVFEDEAFAITPEDELIRATIPDGEVTVEATDVRELQVSSDARYLLWQSTVQTNDDDAWPEGPVFLRDRMTGNTTQVATTALAYVLPRALLLADLGIMHLRLPGEDAWIDRYYHLPDLESIDALIPFGIVGRVDDTVYVESPLSTVNLETFEVETITHKSGVLRGYFNVDPDLPPRLALHQVPQCCIEDDSTRAEGRLWDIEPTGLELAAERATYGHQRLSDGRIVTPLDLSQSLIGNLVLVDPDTLEEQLVDTDVMGLSLRTIWNESPPPSIVYVVQDGERSGVWAARLAK